MSPLDVGTPSVFPNTDYIIIAIKGNFVKAMPLQSTLFL